jgi:hypothetical protein
MILEFPTPSSRETTTETTTLREIAERFVPSPDDMEGDQAGQTTLRYMRGVVETIAAANGDILDQPFDVKQTPHVMESFTQFWEKDLAAAVTQRGLNNTLTKEDLVKLTPQGTLLSLSTDVRRRIKALSSN